MQPTEAEREHVELVQVAEITSFKLMTEGLPPKRGGCIFRMHHLLC